MLVCSSISNAEIKDKILLINVVEQPLIQSVNINGIKAKRIIKSIKDVITLKDRSSYNSILLKQDIEKVLETLQNQGYYFSKVNTNITELDENKININYEIDLGKKSKPSLSLSVVTRTSCLDSR